MSENLVYWQCEWDPGVYIGLPPGRKPRNADKCYIAEIGDSFRDGKGDKRGDKYSDGVGTFGVFSADIPDVLDPFVDWLREVVKSIEEKIGKGNLRLILLIIVVVVLILLFRKIK